MSLSLNLFGDNLTLDESFQKDSKRHIFFVTQREPQVLLLEEGVRSNGKRANNRKVSKYIRPLAPEVNPTSPNV